MSRKAGDIDKFRTLQGLTVKALKALSDALDSNDMEARLRATDMVLKRTMPVPKTSPADIAKAAAMGAAGGVHLAALAAKAAERLAQTVEPTTIEPVSVTFAPLSRVQTSE